MEMTEIKALHAKWNKNFASSLRLYILRCDRLLEFRDERFKIKE